MKYKPQPFFMIEQRGSRFFLLEIDNGRQIETILEICYTRGEAEQALALAVAGNHSTQSGGSANLPIQG